MHFAFTPDQLALRDGLREALTSLGPATDPPTPKDAAELLAGVGLLSARVPEAQGGLGLTDLDLVLCLEECGRAAVPLPVVETVAVAPRLMAGPVGHGELVPGELVPGELVPGDLVTVCLDGSGLVPWPGVARAAVTGDVPADPGAGVRWVPLPAPEAVADVAAVDPHRPLGQVAPGAGTVLPLSPAAVEGAWQAGVLGTAAELTGLAQGALAMTVEYVRGRHQFGVPVGSFQAVKHQLADALRAIELARPLVHAAAWALDRGAPHAPRDVAAAKARAGQAAGLVARACLQCHGGMGYTREYPLHRWLTRIWALQAAWGTTAYHRAVVARSLGLDGAGHPAGITGSGTTGSGTTGSGTTGSGTTGSGRPG